MTLDLTVGILWSSRYFNVPPSVEAALSLQLLKKPNSLHHLSPRRVGDAGPAINMLHGCFVLTEPHFLSKDEFAFVVRHTPLLSFDVIIRDADGNVLVGLRTNEPAKGIYFVPGGIVRKNETLANAFARILKSEIGLKASLSEAKFIGVYEHIYETNTQGERGYGTHYIVLAYELNLVERLDILSDAQHAGFRLMSPLEIASSPEVHPNTQAYFRNAEVR